MLLKNFRGSIFILLMIGAQLAFAAQDYNGTRSNRSAGIVAAENDIAIGIERLSKSASKAAGFLVKEAAEEDPNALLETCVVVSVMVRKLDKEALNDGIDKTDIRRGMVTCD